MTQSQPQPYKVVPKPHGQYEVVGPDGITRGWYATRESAEVLAESLNAGVGRGSESTSPFGPPLPPASPPPPPPAPAPGPNASVANSLKAGVAGRNAFSVASFGKDAGFGVLDAAGGLMPNHFDTRKAANAFADAQRAAMSGVAGNAAAPAAPAVQPLPQGAARSRGTHGAAAIDLADDLKATVGTVQSSASVAAGAFDSLASSAADLVKEFADAAEFMASASPAGAAGAAGVAGAGNASPFNPASRGFKATVAAFAAAFKQARQSPAGGVPLGGNAGMAGAYAAGVAGHVTNAAQAATGIAASAVGKVGQAKVGPGGAALQDLTGFQAASLAVRGSVEAGKLLYDLSRFGLNAVVSMRDFAQRTDDGNKHLARFNVGIASQFQQSQFADWHRNLAFAKTVELTTMTLARSVTEMKDGFAGWEAFVQNTQNRVGTVFAGIAGELGKSASAVGGFLDHQMNQLDPTKTFMASIGPAIGATLGTALQEAFQAFLTGGLSLPETPGKIQGAANAAAQAAAAQLAQRNQFADQWPKGMHQLVQGAPIRGKRAMPRP